jgi:hypothetical protein
MVTRHTDARRKCASKTPIPRAQVSLRDKSTCTYAGSERFARSLAMQHDQVGAWEAAALDVLEQLGRPPAPIDSLLLTLSVGLELAPTTTPAAMLVGRHVMLWPGFSPRQIRWNAAHELGHWALMQRGIADPELAADGVGRALVLPQYAFDPDVAGWHVGELQRVHHLCSLEVIARRVLSLRDACLSIWRHGKCIRRHCSGAVPASLSRVTRFEALLAGAARRRGGVVLAAPGLVGFVDDEHPTRVITLCSTEELARRCQRPS